MPMIFQCSEPGCETLTMGPLCLEHEQLLGLTVARPVVTPDADELAASLGRQAELLVRTASEPVAAAPLRR
jgi:hypothetical protein